MHCCLPLRIAQVCERWSTSHTPVRYRVVFPARGSPGVQRLLGGLMTSMCEVYRAWRSVVLVNVCGRCVGVSLVQALLFAAAHCAGVQTVADMSGTELLTGRFCASASGH